MSTNYRYHYLHIEIRKVENVNIVLNEAIDSYVTALDECENIEELKSLFLDFMVTTRTQMNVLSGGVSDLDKLNKAYILNGGNSGDNIIKPYSDDKFKKEQIGFRY